MPDAALPTRLIGERYQLERRLGRGGMADVYLARDIVLERAVALKMLRKRGTEAGAVERIHREAVTLASLRSNHVVALLDARVDDDGVYLVMEYVDGPSLQQLITERGTLPAARAIRLVNQILDGLAVLHANRFVHRDIKPANILIDANERAVLVDLGLVFDPRRPSLTPFDSTVGTVSYMAPEQKLSNVVGSRSDLYQVGLVLLQAITGVEPAHLGEPMEEHLPSLLVQVPAPLAAVLRRALSTQAEQRFGSAAEMKTALLDAAHRVQGIDGDGEAHPDGLGAAPRSRARRWPVIGAGARAIALAAFLAMGSGKATPAGPTVVVAEVTQVMATTPAAPHVIPEAAMGVIEVPAPEAKPAPDPEAKPAPAPAPAAEAKPVPTPAPEPAPAPEAKPAPAPPSPVARAARAAASDAPHPRPASHPAAAEPPPSPAAQRMVAFKSADPLLRAALDHEREGRQVEAKASYREYLSQHPDGIDAPAVRRRLSQLR